MLTINREKLFSSHEAFWFLIDFLMLALLLVNMAWIIFDTIYGLALVQELAQREIPAFAAFYAPIHKHFILYDIMFVTVFLVEFGVRWIRAMVNKTYYRWYFYPFIHWYDLVGCIPSGTYRFLRILRIASIIYRLDQYEIIDFKRTRLYRFLNFYYEAFMEELSDRIVIKILSGAQEEIRHGSTLLTRIRNDVLLPRRDQIQDWLSRRLAETVQNGYIPHRATLRRYLEGCVDDALQQNQEIRRIRQIPMLGQTVSSALDAAVGDIVSHVIHQILDDLATPQNHPFVEDLVAGLIYESEAEEEDANHQLIRVVNEILDLVKAQMRIKRWRTSL